MANSHSRTSHWLLRLCIGAFITLLIVFVFQFSTSYATVGQSGPIETATALPFQVTPTPFFSLPTLPSEDYARFQVMTGEFSHPASRLTPASPPTFQDLLASPAEYDGYLLEFKAEIIQEAMKKSGNAVSSERDEAERRTGERNLY